MTADGRARIWATLALGAGLLAGCAGAAPAGSPGGVPTTVLARDGIATSPGVPEPSPTTVPVTAAPTEFVDRAGLVADAVRRAGVPTRPVVPVLQAPWDVDAGFDTVAQKEAWGRGHVTFAPGVDTDATSTGTMRLASGSARSVDVIGVRAALDRALDGALDAPAPCDNIPAAECRLVVSEAVLTQTSVESSQGRLTLPAWRLTVDGLSHPITVVAVADGVLVRPQQPPSPLPGLPDAPQGLRAADSLRGVDGSTVVVGIGHGACDPNLAAHVVEFDDLVVVGGTADPPPADTVCPAIYLSTPAELHLTRPLGERPVIDAVTGLPRFLGVPAS